MAHTELDLSERRTIEDMLNAKIPVSRFAAEIGRQVAELQIRAAVLNGYTALGISVTEPVG